ncbi:MAG: rRNA pseudouridine synthase [Bacteroidaceae bacterium]|nr:rRNA pseudouridine synthase [Bacteroidaceae bacterium]
MEEEKKAKRPRIGETRGAVREELTPNNEKKEYSNYTEGRNTENQSSYNNERRQYNNGYNRGGYNNRYNNNRSYNNGGYNNRYSNPNEGENTNNDDTQQENSYTRNNYNRGYNNNRSSYNNNRGGYNNRNNYNNNRSGYNNNRYNNGYNNRYNNDVERTESDSTQNSYSQERSQNSEGTYNRNNYNNGYNNERRQYNNGYNRNNYNNNRGEGYNNNRNSYNNNRGGYNNNRNSYNNNRSEGYNNNRNGYNNQRGGFNTKRFTPRPQRVEYELPPIDPTQPIRLNKFLANAGLCSRREADEFIQAGEVQVNGEVVTELGSKITPADIITFRGKEVGLENKVYILLNKPKDCVTTADDPQGRLTVMDIVRNACTERIYPVGRLDRNTTGVLLLTNDGDLASKLTHPKFVKKKIYHVWTDKDVTEEDMQRIADGIDLDDGSIHADAVSYATETDRNQVGIEIHSGRNRIVRRIFEALGYRVIKLDRVYFAGLTKKNLPRGRWRHLTQAEVNMLMMGSFE